MRLEYDFYHYSQLGTYRCPHCGFARPPIDFDACGISTKDGLSFEIKEHGSVFPVKANYRGFYNIYNILACYAAVRTAGIGTDGFSRMLEAYNPENGRNELFSIGGKSVLLNLAKNPAGFNQNISSVMEDRTEKDLIIVINDNAQDGTDVSWLWDVDFDRLEDSSVRSITVSGLRGRDMQLRLKYVSIRAELIENVTSAIEARLKDGYGNLYVLVNYTALYSTHQILKNLEKSGR
jgi:UDP-N-acetylmuramyl tripeptide synthase